MAQEKQSIKRMTPTKEMKGALSGALLLADISAASMSALRLPIHRHALTVLGLRTNERKKAYIEKFPPDIQGMLKKECRRLYDQRSKNEN